MRLLPLVATALLCPAIAFAAGSNDSTPPKPTQTATDCTAGQVYDKATKACLDAKSNLHDDDTRYEAVRELAHAGQYDRALLVLAAMSDPSESRVLTYQGFLARKTGDMPQGFAFYARALDADADNLLARSYLGQALVELGQIEAAKLQLAQIDARGGTGTWAEHALGTAIATGRGFTY